MMKNGRMDKGESIRIGRGKTIVRMPREEWEDHLLQMPERHAGLLKFMTREHHIVRNFIVRELPRMGRPMESLYIADQLGLSLERVRGIIEDLESNLFFLVRNESGAVSWAYPVTVDETPHRLSFSTGERLFAA